MRRMVFVAATASVAATVLAQTPYALDTSFRTDIISWYVGSVALMQDSSLLLSGDIKFPGDMSSRGGAKLLQNGQQDVNFPMFPLTTGGGRLTHWQDRFYVSNGLVRRLLPSGLIDASFIDMNTSPYFEFLQSGDYHVYPDGRVLVCGLHQLSDSIRGYVGFYDLIWFSNQGYLDTTAHHRQGNGVIFHMHQLPNGQFICASTCTQFEGKAVDWFFRFNADGTPDTTFRTGVYIGDGLDFLPLQDGRVYVGGNFRRSVEPQDTLRLVRFMPDGSLDPSFNIPQFTASAAQYAPYGAEVHSLRDWGDGRFVATGLFDYVNGLPRGGICMFDSTGQVLDVFDNCSVSPFSFLGNPRAVVMGIIPSYDSTAYYIWGSYVEVNDGTIDDTLQRFVSRIYIPDINTAVAAPEPQVSREGFVLYPNPASRAIMVELGQVLTNAVVVLRDPLGREVLRRMLNAQQTELDLSVLGGGVYTVELFNGAMRKAVEKLILE